MNKITKTIVGFVGIAMALSLVAVSPASAAVDFSTMSTADLQALFAQLQSRLGGVQAPAMTAPTFTRSLTLGSSGADVTALQNWLIGKGYSIPAGATGYFGAQTKAAVAAYQLAKGIAPAAGYFGPVTQARVAADSAMVVVPPTGTPNTPSTVADGQDGSVTISYSPYVTSSQTIKKGETKDIYAVKLKATSGSVNVNRFDIHFSERPWLVFSKVTLKDSNGNVLATKNLSSSADATEVTVGSDYLVRFDNVNFNVTPATDPILVVSASVLAASDKITGQSVTVSFPSGSLRTVNGRGYTDSLGGLSSNTVTLSTSGSTGDLYTRNSPSAPDKRIVTTSVNTTTNDVVLGVFSVKTQNQASTLNSFSININNSTGAATTSLFQNVRLVAGGQTYGANSLSAGGTTFSNLTVNLPEDTWTDLKVIADVIANVTGVSASTTLVKASVVGVDANYNTVTLTNASNVTSNDVVMQTSGLQISGMSATANVSGGNGGNIGAGVTFTFTATNTGNSNVFISKVPGVALATSTTGSAGSPATASSTLTYVSASTDTLADDTGTAPTSGAYVIPAGGSRTFTYTGALDNTNGTVGLRVFKITQINFGSSAGTPTGSNVNFNLSALTVTPNLGNN